MALERSVIANPTIEFVILKRIGVALRVVALVLPLQAMAQDDPRSCSRSSRSSSALAHVANQNQESLQHARGNRLFGKTPVAKRGSNGKIRRSASARAEFMRRTGYPNRARAMWSIASCHLNVAG